MHPDDESAYAALAEVHEDARWAFGTGFDDPLSGVDTTVPAGVDGAALAAYCVMLGDDALVSAQRLTGWVTRAPELEEEVALANIGLDLLGQARLLLSRAAQADPAVVPAGGTDVPEDALAYFREQHEFRNVRLCELDNGDFAFSIVRLLVLSAWRLAVFDRLTGSADPVLAAIAAKGVKELTYHRDHAARWVVRLGDSTPVARAKVEAALAAVWPWLPELFRTSAVEAALPGVAVDPAAVRAEVDAVLDQVLTAATLTAPEVPPAAPVAGRTGRDGVHTEALSYLLAELQSVARAHPGATW
ncbi:MAG TPA: 1,2-phenylacetyl-CoA epoxidase subunit PaaC [Mycobacteriales bacterium]|jgi:ring-1,2-phenylacetyl-CoA epoxidase subunit PaaC|nr:1,2-phenylacetyl-CoA epoxidase subunit PaaC [Mycobacteriales bacterium]